MIQFTPWPEMIVWPYLILKGWLPYSDIAIAHTPLLLFITAAWYKLVGLGLVQLQLLTWLIFFVTLLLVLAISRSIKTALVYIALWATFGGNGLWFDLALAPLAILLFQFVQSSRPIASGLVLGMILLTKQTGFWFLLPALMVLKPASQPRFLIAVIAVLVIFLLFLQSVGIIDDFWTWAIKFGIFTLPRSPGQILLPSFKQFAAAAVPFAVFVLVRSNRPLLPWVIAGSLGVYPRWELWHFQPALPFLAFGLSKSSLVAAIVTGYCLLLVARSPAASYPRFFEPEFIQLADAVRSHSSPGDHIFILNTWDHLYALTDTLPATRPLIPNLPWYMDQPGIQEQIVSNLQTTPPRLVVIRDPDASGRGAYQPRLIGDFVILHYQPTGRVGQYQILGVK